MARLRAGVLTLLLACASAFAVTDAVAAERSAAGEFDNILRAHFVHCAFYRDYETDWKTGNLVLVEGRSDSLTHFQGMDAARGRARAISTRKAGAREVRVAGRGRYLHFIDYAAGMYILTTIHSCIARNEGNGTCITYGAAQARHFDARVLRDPDLVFDELRSRADPGFCDHSFIGMEAASTPAAR
jgi:hypothetical protein